MSQTWTAPEPPGPEVTHVRDRNGVLWRHEDGFWWGHIGHTGEDGTPYEDYRKWWEILPRGPLTDATGEA